MNFGFQDQLFMKKPRKNLNTHLKWKTCFEGCILINFLNVFRDSKILQDSCHILSQRTQNLYKKKMERNKVNLITQIYKLLIYKLQQINPNRAHLKIRKIRFCSVCTIIFGLLVDAQDAAVRNCAAEQTIFVGHLNVSCSNLSGILNMNDMKGF